MVLISGTLLVSADEAVPNVDSWLSGNPTIRQEQVLSSWQPTTQSCNKTLLKVLRGAGYVQEEHCMFSTATGLVSSLADVIQPTGYSTAYPLEDNLPGRNMLVPVPNQASALVISSASGSGVNIRMFRQLYAHTKFDYHFNFPRFILDQQPDIWFRRADNSLMQFNYNDASAFSADGRYLIVDALDKGFVKIDLATLEIKQFADTIIRQNGSSLLSAEPAIDNDGRYAAIAYNAPGGWGEKFFRITDTKECKAKPHVGRYNEMPNACPTRDLLPELKAEIPGLSSIANVEFANNRTILFDALVKTGSGNKYYKYSITAPGQKKSLVQYLALGDSFSSGEGAYDYREGTDTERNMCHQSLVSYPYLLKGYFDSFEDIACSGARIINIIGGENKAETAQLTNQDEPADAEITEATINHLPGYIAQMRFINSDNPEVVTMSIGGNNFGFKRIILQCLDLTRGPIGSIGSQATCYDTYERRAELVQTINQQFDSLKDIYQRIRDANNMNRRLYVIGYPQVAKPGGDCGVNVQMNADEVQFASDLIHYMNTVIKQAAAESGAFYVDTEHAFDGHKLCEEGSKAVNGITISRIQDELGGNNVLESFHPNKLGHQLFAATIEAQTHNLSAPMPDAIPQTSGFSIDPNIPLLQNVPKTGTPIRYVRAATSITSSYLKREIPVNINLKNIEYPFKSFSQVSVILHSDPVDLGTYTTDENGDISTQLTIPASVPPGYHTLHVYGDDIFGNPIDIQQLVYVQASENDYDGDGIPNDKDSCDIITNSGQDADMDGVDDACDDVIGDPPLPVSGAGNIRTNTDSSTTVAQYRRGTSLVQTAATITSAGTTAAFDVSQAGTITQNGEPLQDSNNPQGSVLGSTNDDAVRNRDRIHNNYLLDAGIAVLISLPVLLVGWRFARSKA